MISKISSVVTVWRMVYFFFSPWGIYPAPILPGLYFHLYPFCHLAPFWIWMRGSLNSPLCVTVVFPKNEFFFFQLNGKWVFKFVLFSTLKNFTPKCILVSCLKKVSGFASWGYIYFINKCCILWKITSNELNLNVFKGSILCIDLLCLIEATSETHVNKLKIAGALVLCSLRIQYITLSSISQWRSLHEL